MIEQTDSIDERSLSEAIEDSATHCQYCGKRLLTEWGAIQPRTSLQW